MTIEPYRVSAYNTAQQSENKIHDDNRGAAVRISAAALVPGVGT